MSLSDISILFYELKNDPQSKINTTILSIIVFRRKTDGIIKFSNAGRMARRVIHPPNLPPGLRFSKIIEEIKYGVEFHGEYMYDWNSANPAWIGKFFIR